VAADRRREPQAGSDFRRPREDGRVSTNQALKLALQDLLRCVNWLREAQRNDRTYRELVDLFGGVVEEWVQKRAAERQAIADRKAERARARTEKLQREQQRKLERDVKRMAKLAKV